VLYVLPTMFIVIVFFVLPILLVGQMSASDWELLRGNSGINFPDNYTAVESNSLFVGAVTFTIIYTVLVTVLLIGLGAGIAVGAALTLAYRSVRFALSRPSTAERRDD